MMRLIVPLAYLYIALISLREISDSWKTFSNFIETYLPTLNVVIQKMQKSSRLVEIWVMVEAIFYIVQRLHIQYLQYQDPLEASLLAAPILTSSAREQLFKRIMEHIFSDDPVGFIRGWFFDEKLENITRYDICDFLAWCMFESRNQEHLTNQETEQLHDMVHKIEYCLSIHLYGLDVERGETKTNGKERNHAKAIRIIRHDHCHYNSYSGRTASLDVGIRNIFGETLSGHSWSDIDSESSAHSENHETTQLFSYNDIPWESDTLKKFKPLKLFRFVETTHDESPVFFTSLYENYKRRHEQYRGQLEKLENIASRLHEAEENAIAVASNMYESAYSKLVDKGSAFDKRLNAVSDAMHNQLNEAWNSVSKVKERLETAHFVTSRKRALQQQLKGYRMLLEKAINSNSVPPRQMVDLMRKITQCNENLEAIEHSAMNAFLKAMRLDVSQLLQRREPQRYAKYTEDPLLGLAVYPLVFHLSILGLTDGLLRLAMKSRGFERLRIGSTVYYYHKGNALSINEGNIDNGEDEEDEEESLVPIVFCHGIGIGLSYYLFIIDELLKMGHPLFLPEIPYVCGFRPWLSRKSILTPHAAVATLTAMLASHGHMKATFIGHSYGTSWLSYMCKYSPDSIAALQFLDPIVFCLHMPCLTKSFVYHRSDPGSTSYMVRTDVIINWTIQRSFPWSRIALFVEDLPANVPCAIYISEEDVLIPVDAVKSYLQSKGAHICDLKDASAEHFSKGPINVTILRGQAHGDWPTCPVTSRIIAETARVLTEQAECGKGDL
jgi:Predicted hydrolases or acyltransferases (alpha/beta hydrolase superfamily)